MAKNAQEYVALFSGKDNLSPVIKSVTANVQKAESAFDKFGINIPKLMARAAVTIPIWAALRASVLALPNALAAAGKEWLTFQTEMSRVATATRGSAQTLKILEDGIVSFTKTTGASFKDAASAVYALGSAGLTASQQLAGLPAVMNLAIGTFGDIEQSAKLLSGIFNVFGKSLTGVTTDFEKFQKIANVLSYTYALQQVELDELATALGYVSSVGNLVNVSFEDMTATIGFLNSSLLKGSKAGTALLNAFIEIAQKPQKLRELGIDIDTSKPVEFRKVMEDLNKQFGGASLSLGDLNKLIDIFGNRGGKAIAVILTRWDKWREALKDTNDPKAMEGFAEALRLQAEDNIPAQFRKMANKVTSIFFNMFDNLEIPLKGFIKDINNALDRFDSMEKARKSFGEKTRIESGLQGAGGALAGAALLAASPLLGRLGGGLARGGTRLLGLPTAVGVGTFKDALSAAQNQQLAQLAVQSQVFRGVQLAQATKNLSRLAKTDPTAAAAYGLFQQAGGRGLGASVARGNVQAVKNLFPVQSLFTLFTKNLVGGLQTSLRPVINSLGTGLERNILRGLSAGRRFLVGEQFAQFRQRSIVGGAGQIASTWLGRAAGGVGILNIINGLAQAIAPDSKLAKYLLTLTNFINTTLIKAIDAVITVLEAGVGRLQKQLIAITQTPQGQIAGLDIVGAAFKLLSGDIPGGLNLLSQAQNKYKEAVAASVTEVEKATNLEKQKAELARVLAAQAPGNQRAALYFQGLGTGNQALETYRRQAASMSELNQLVNPRSGQIGRRGQVGPGTGFMNFLDTLERGLSQLPAEQLAKTTKEELAARIKPQIEKFAAGLTDEELKEKELLELRTESGRAIWAEVTAMDILNKLAKETVNTEAKNLDLKRKILEQNTENTIALKVQTGEYTAVQAAQAELNKMLASYNMGKAGEDILSVSQLQAMTDDELVRYLEARIGDEEKILAIRKKILEVTISEREEILKTGKVIKDLFTGTFTDLFAGKLDFKDFGKTIAEGFNQAMAEQFGDIVGGGLTDVLGLDVAFGSIFTNLRNTMSGPIGKIKNAMIEGAIKAAPILEQAMVDGAAKVASGTGVNTGDAVGGGLAGGIIGGLGQVLPSLGNFLNTPAYFTNQKVNQSIWAPGVTQSVQREVAVPGLTGAQLIGGGLTAGLAGFSGFQAAGGGGWGALRGGLAGAGSALMAFGGPIGMAVGGLMTLGSMFIKGQQDPGQPPNTSTTENFSVTSRIDVTNKQLMMVNRNLVALRQELTYILPESAFFSEKNTLEDNFAVSMQRGL